MDDGALAGLGHSRLGGNAPPLSLDLLPQRGVRRPCRPAKSSPRNQNIAARLHARHTFVVVVALVAYIVGGLVFTLFFTRLMTTLGMRLLPWIVLGASLYCGAVYFIRPL